MLCRFCLLTPASGRLWLVVLVTLGLAGGPAPFAHADWGLQKVFDFSDGYPGTGTEIGVSGTNPSIHNDIVMFGVSGGSNQGIFRYERGNLISFVDNGPGESFTSISVSSSVAHDPYGAFVANGGSGSGIYTRSVDTQHVAFPIATQFTPIPSGTGNFTSFGDKSIDGQRVTFVGFGSSSQRGIYAKDVNSLGDPSLVIERFATMPNSIDNFQSLNEVSHRGNTVVFTGNGSSSSGVYFRSISGLTIAYGTVADTNTNIPRRGATKFTSLQDPAYDGSSSAFYGSGGGGAGVYTNQGGPLRTVADTGTPIPEASGNFTSIAIDSVSIDGDIAFEATGAGGLRGVYIEKDGVLEKVVATGDVVDGRTVSGVSIGRDGFSNGYLAMRLSFPDFGSTFYAAFAEHRWDPAGGAGGNWDDQTNWPLGARPGDAVGTFIEPDGPALIQGPTSFTHMRSLSLGAQTAGTAELHLQPTGQILIDETLTVQAAGRLTGDGALHATGGIDNQGEIDLGNNSVTLSGGLINNHGLLRGNGEVDNRLTNHADGEVRVESGQTIRFTGSSNSNSGKLRLNNGGTAEFTGPLTNTASGQITGRGTLIADGGLINGGDLSFSGGFTDVYGDVTQSGGDGRVIVSGGSTTTFYDDVVHNGQEIRVASDSIAVFFGHVSGAGPYTGTGTVHFEGTFSPGNSPGLAEFDGDLIYGPTAVTILQLGGLLRGTEYDAINVAGEWALDGTLQVELINGFHPRHGDSFDLLNAATFTGQFHTVLLPALNHGLVFDTSLLNSSGLLTVIPEPGTAVVVGLCWSGLVFRRRR